MAHSALALARVAGNRATSRLLGARPPSRRLARALRAVADTGETAHVRWGNASVNDVPVPEQGTRPVVIEVMENDKASAKAKIDRLATIAQNNAQLVAPPNNPQQALAPPANGRTTPSRLAIAIAFNGKAKDTHYTDKGLTANWTLAQQYSELISDCAELANYLEQQGVMGAVFPLVWCPTELGGGYTFPFLEMRARTTLHAGSRDLVKTFSDWAEPVVRGMDADVSNDPLLNDTAAMVTAPLETLGEGEVLSGGYDWDSRPKPPAFWGATTANGDVARWNDRWTRILDAINLHEHRWRKLMASGRANLLYWPEPNIYMTATMRQAGAEQALKAVKPGVQMRESVFYLRKPASEGTLKGTYVPTLATTKPAKDAYFTGLRDLIKQADSTPVDKLDLDTVLANIRQTHLGPSHVADIQKTEWYGVKSPLTPELTEKVDAKRATALKALADAVTGILTQ